jgi:FAD/FMN-containing dehydrogenase
VTASPHARLLDDLTEIVGPAHCLSDRDVVTSYESDWTGRYRGQAAAVVRPGTEAELAAVLRTVAGHGAAAIPQGGNTGLVGGSVPRSSGEVGGRRQVVVRTTRFDEVHSCDAGAGLIDLGAGVTLSSAQRSARASGCDLGIDLASRESATIGGMIATNAGGIHVLRHGAMRARVRGVEAVLADGTVVSQMAGLVKDNVSWEISSLLCGSEGTLAIVTRSLVRLEPLPAHRVTALAAVRDVAALVRLVNGPLRSVSGLEAAELTLADGMSLVCGHAGLAAPPGAALGAAAWLTVEAAGNADPTRELAEALEDPSVLEVAVAVDDAARARLWAYRERHTESIATLGVPHKLDVSTRPAHLAELIDRVPAAVEAAAPGARVVMFGHVADGNVHVNVIGPAADDTAADDAVFELVLSLGGSVSAEHGVGIAKRRWLRASRTEGTLELMGRVKRALDPQDVLNPGVLEPLPGPRGPAGARPLPRSGGHLVDPGQ